jgi:hypothetical protein
VRRPGRRYRFAEPGYLLWGWLWQHEGKWRGARRGFERRWTFRYWYLPGWGLWRVRLWPWLAPRLCRLFGHREDGRLDSCRGQLGFFCFRCGAFTPYRRLYGVRWRAGTVMGRWLPREWWRSDP